LATKLHALLLIEKSEIERAENEEQAAVQRQGRNLIFMSRPDGESGASPLSLILRYNQEQHQASFRQMQLISAMRERSLALAPPTRGLVMTTNTPMSSHPQMRQSFTLAPRTFVLHSSSNGNEMRMNYAQAHLLDDDDTSDY
jgi:hypothetical protein